MFDGKSMCKALLQQYQKFTKKSTYDDWSEKRIKYFKGAKVER